MSEPVRLAKRVAELKGCSRREAEQYIEGGWVTVDGVVVEEPQSRVQDQQVEIDPGGIESPRGREVGHRRVRLRAMKLFCASALL